MNKASQSDFEKLPYFILNMFQIYIPALAGITSKRFFSTFRMTKCYTECMIIRPATREDKEQILRLIYEFDEYFAKDKLFSDEILPFTQYKDRETLFENVVDTWLANPENFVFVADDNGKLIGHIVGSIQTKNDRVLDKEGSIDEWFVTESARGSGVGKQLYDALLEVFKVKNCNHVGLKVYSANKNTIDMYRKIGFLDLELTMVKKVE